MKTKFFWILVIFFGLFLGCNLKKNIPVVSPPVVEEKNDSIKPFEQKFRKNLAIGDSVTFYPSMDIVIHKNLDEEYNYVEGGVIFSVDSNKIAKITPKMTAGKLISIGYKKGTSIIDLMIISSTKKEVEYIFYYFKRGSLPQETDFINGVKIKLIPRNPNTFILGGNAFIKFRGEKYKIDVTSENKCYLLVDYRKIVAEDDSDEGWTF